MQNTSTPKKPTIESIPVRNAIIGRDTPIARALPSRQKKMIGAWCFLDHAGPVSFPAGQGLDVGPHPHIGLQTFTWMIAGTVMHTDSLGSKQLISPNQINLMTAGHGISHTEVTPPNETTMHAAQLWIALPDAHLHTSPAFTHYATLPVVQQNKIIYTILVGTFLEKTSPVTVYTPLVGVDIYAEQTSETTLHLNPAFEYGILVLAGTVKINGQLLDQSHLLTISTEADQLHIALNANSRLLFIGGEPFDTDIVLWWNFVGRDKAGLLQAREDWERKDPRFGEILDYPGDRLNAPAFPETLKIKK